MTSGRDTIDALSSTVRRLQENRLYRDFARKRSPEETLYCLENVLSIGLTALENSGLVISEVTRSELNRILQASDRRERPWHRGKEHVRDEGERQGLEAYPPIKRELRNAPFLSQVPHRLRPTTLTHPVSIQTANGAPKTIRGSFSLSSRRSPAQTRFTLEAMRIAETSCTHPSCMDACYFERRIASLARSIAPHRLPDPSSSRRRRQRGFGPVLDGHFSAHISASAVTDDASGREANPAVGTSGPARQRGRLGGDATFSMRSGELCRCSCHEQGKEVIQGRYLGGLYTDLGRPDVRKEDRDRRDEERIDGEKDVRSPPSSFSPSDRTTGQFFSCDGSGAAIASEGASDIAEVSEVVSGSEVASSERNPAFRERYDASKSGGSAASSEGSSAPSALSAIFAEQDSQRSKLVVQSEP